MQKIIVFILLAIAVYSCGGTVQNQNSGMESEVVELQKPTFETFFKDWALAVNNEDYKYVSAVFYKDGVGVIESSGAMPTYRIIFSADELPENPELKVTETVMKGELPIIDCDADNYYSKEGCYYSNTGGSLITEILPYCGLNETELLKEQSKTKQISLVVIDTHSFGYYFAEKENGWILLFIDARTPCEA
jgi:hypothetical protein